MDTQSLAMGQIERRMCDPACVNATVLRGVSAIGYLLELRIVRLAWFKRLRRQAARHAMTAGFTINSESSWRLAKHELRRRETDCVRFEPSPGIDLQRHEANAR